MIKPLIIFIVVLYATASVVGLMAGVIDQWSRDAVWVSFRNPCKRYPASKIGSLFPSYKLGCWLGEPLGKE